MYAPSQLCRDCWSAHECFLRLGYQARHIFITEAEGVLFVVLKPDARTFSLSVGEFTPAREPRTAKPGSTEPSEALKAFSTGEWTEFCAELPTLSDEQLREWFFSFLARIGGGTLLILKMLEKGFTPDGKLPS